jgi:hypothetical protein
MDLHKVLLELYEEKKRLEEVIASLESLQKADGGRHAEGDDGAKRRGRRGMGPEERINVSQRMKQYWAKRRKERDRE